MLDLEGGSAPPGASLALARKWRPSKFSEIVGQDHAVGALVGALASGRFHHAYMFTGTRGIGKTTIARILAKGFNCEQPADGEPCGSCDQCAQIDAGSHPDIIEMDAASTTKVEHMRSLLESAQYAPVLGRFKIYIIDEVHMLSHSSFNAMLKTLEEPPEHVKFILATTDPRMVPATVQSRCLRFSLRRMPDELIVERLSFILAEEGFAFEQAALPLIASHADGSMRDALSILDEALAGNEKLEEQKLRKLVGAADPDQAPNLLASILNSDTKAVLEQTAALHRQALSLERICDELVALLHEAQLVGAAPDLADQVDEAAKTAAAQLDEIQIQVAYEIASQGRQRIAEAPEPKTALDMILLRIIAVIGSNDKKKEKPASSAAGAAPAPAKQEAPAPAPTPPTPSAPPAKQQEVASKPKAEPAVETEPEPEPKAEAKEEEEPSEPAPKPAEVSQETKLPSDANQWQAWIDSITGPAKALGRECAFVKLEGQTIHLKIAKEGESQLMLKESLVAKLADSAGHPVKLEIEVGSVDAETPLQVEEARVDEQKKEMIKQVEEIVDEAGITKSFPNAKVTDAKRGS